MSNVKDVVEGMADVPNVVRLSGTPKRVAAILSPQDRKYVTREHTSVILIESERAGNVITTLRTTLPGIVFADKRPSLKRTRLFRDGEQHALNITWQLVIDAKVTATRLTLECDVAYADSADKHTATIPFTVTYTPSRKVMAAGAAVAGAAVAAAAVVREAVQRRSATKKKKAASKKAAAKKPAKKASAKKAGGARRGSSASRSAPRKDARGSSAGRKPASRRPTRKSR